MASFADAPTIQGETLRVPVPTPRESHVRRAPPVARQAQRTFPAPMETRKRFVTHTERRFCRISGERALFGLRFEGSISSIAVGVSPRKFVTLFYKRT